MSEMDVLPVSVAWLLAGSQAHATTDHLQQVTYMLINHPPRAQGESASLKRDRLLQRNTILRRTGFIEGGRLGPRTSSFLGAALPSTEGGAQ